MKIAVIGDIMLDKYDFCRNRNNPESSAPCYTVERTEYKPGGAGNVAANLARLEDDFVLLGVAGADENGQTLLAALDRLKIPKIILKDEGRPTIVKERTLSSIDGRYHFRKDTEMTDYIQENHVAEVIERVRGFELIIVSDYRKGMISERLMTELKKTGIPILADTKPEHKNLYKGVFMIKPNSKEATQMAGINDEIRAAERLVSDLETSVLLTRGERGISFFGINGDRFDFPASARKVVDITGAGDTVIATFAHFLAENSPIRECVRLANKAAGIAVEYPGCYAVSEAEILGE